MIEVKLCYLFDFSIYHERWEELEEMDFSNMINLNKGAGAMVGHFKVNEMEYTEKKGKVGKQSIAYLEKLTQLCDEQGISLVLMISPYAATTDEQKGHNAMAPIAKKLDVAYLNLINRDVIDYSIDMFDRGHCNMAGGIRVTDYLGNYLIETYGEEMFLSDDAER